MAKKKQSALAKLLDRNEPEEDPEDIKIEEFIEISDSPCQASPCVMY
jgi:hypothetical protein